MRIAVLMSIASPWSRQVVRQLHRLQHAVHVIDFRRTRASLGYVHSQDPFQAEDIASFHKLAAGVHLLDSRFLCGIRYFSCARQFRRIFQECGADIAVTLYGGGWATLAWLSGVSPYAVYVVGSDVLMAKRATRWLERRALQKAAIVFANGGYLAEHTRLLAPKADVFPMVMGVDTNRLRPGLAPAMPVKILCTRGFLPVYNNELIVQCLAALPDPDADIRVTFTSRGRTLEAVRRLAEKVCPLSLRQKITFLRGVTDCEMLDNLQQSHIYVSVSRSDGTSISLLEALACGLFPILSDIPQNREWVDPALNNGILVPLDRPDVLAQALAKAISDPALRARAATINRQLILERADAAKNMSILASKLEAIVAARKRQ